MFLELEAKIAVIPDTFRETDTAPFCCRQYVKATINGWLASQKLMFDLRPCCDGDEMRLFLDSGDSRILFDGIDRSETRWTRNAKFTVLHSHVVFFSPSVFPRITKTFIVIALT